MNDKKGDPEANDPEARLAMALFRHRWLWNQKDLAIASQIAPSQISLYDQGARAIPRELLERMARAAKFPVELIDPLLRILRAFRTATGTSLPSGQLLPGRTEAELYLLMREMLHLVPVPATAAQEPGTADREKAEKLWFRLKPLAPRERRLLTEEASEFQTWALCEHVAAESITQAGNCPAEALALAELAVRIAELTEGAASWRNRLEGYAWVHVANARRVSSDLPGADEAFHRGAALWALGVPADPDLLDETWLPWIEAALRKDQRRFTEALERIEEALACDRGVLRGKILLTKASILQMARETAASTDTLFEAAPLVAEADDPRLEFLLRFTLIATLCEEGRIEEASALLPEVQTIAVHLGGSVDLARVRWLEGKILAARGMGTEARHAFEEVAREFLSRRLAYDYALVSLELATLLLSENRTREVSSLASDLVWIFQAQEVTPNVAVALRLFLEAALQEAATVGLTRQVLQFLSQAKWQPELEFEEIEA